MVATLHPRSRASDGFHFFRPYIFTAADLNWSGVTAHSNRWKRSLAKLFRTRLACSAPINGLDVTVSARRVILTRLSTTLPRNTSSAQSTPTRSKVSGRSLSAGSLAPSTNVSKKYLHLYVAEFQFHYNNRFNDDIFGKAIEGC